MPGLSGRFWSIQENFDCLGEKDYLYADSLKLFVKTDYLVSVEKSGLTEKMKLIADSHNNYIFEQKESVTNAVIWGGGLQIGRLLLQLLLGVVLARLLSPADFGLLAEIMIFNYIAMFLSDGGFTTALLQRKHIGPTETSSVFYINMSISLILYIFFYFFAPLVADFYGQPRLTNLMRVLLLVIPINVWGQIVSIILTKQLHQRAMAVANIGGIILSAPVAIYMACKGYGAWALVVQTLLMQIVQVAFLLKSCWWCPILQFNANAVREMFAFGSKMLTASLLNIVFDNIYTAVIGKVYSVVELGFYNKALTFSRLVPVSLSRTIESVLFPVLVDCRDNRTQFLAVFNKILLVSSFSVFPVCIFVSVFSHSIVLFLLGERWLTMAPYMTLLSINFAILPLQTLNMQVLAVLGESGKYLKLEGAKKIFVIVAIAATWMFPLYYMVAGQVAVSFLLTLLSGIYSKRFLGYGIGHQLQRIAPYFFSALTCAWACRLTLGWYEPRGIWQLLAYLIICITLFVIAYMGSALLFRAKPLLIIFDILQKKLKFKSNIFTKQE